MKQYFICVDCIEKTTGKSLSSLTVQEWNELKNKMSFDSEIISSCPLCNSNNIMKVYGINSAYIKGYGYLDKKGVKNDMDLHAMVYGRDPYREHRKDGEVKEVINKLQKSKEFDPHSKAIGFKPIKP